MTATDTGVLGLEAVHIFDGSLELNTPPSAGMPRFRLTGIPGLRSRADFDEVHTDPVGHTGEVPRQSVLRGKTVVYEGLIYATTLAEMRAAARALLGAFSVVDDREMRIVPDVAYEGGVEYVYRARPIAFDCPEVQEMGPSRLPTPYQRSFTASLRQNDPRYYRPTVLTETGADVTCENTGTAPTDPVIVISGESSGAWRIVRDGPGAEPDRVLSFGLALDGTDDITIDFVNGTIRKGPLAPFPAMMGSTWLNAGIDGLPAARETEIVLEAVGGGTIDATMTVSWRNADW